VGRELRDRFPVARFYRKRAKEIRSVASGQPEDDDRDLLINLAAEYERLASLAEARGSSAQG
jgi:hypothetical protein